VLGLVLLRGEEVVSLTIEGPPPQEDLRALKAQAAPPGTGAGRAAGRGLPVAAPGQAPAVRGRWGRGAGDAAPPVLRASLSSAGPRGLPCRTCLLLPMPNPAHPAGPSIAPQPAHWHASVHHRALRAPRAAWAAPRRGR
jgi:small nuclear ribonucleoprotein B and B'